MEIKYIVGLAISLIIIAVIVPIGLAYLAGAANMSITVGNTTKTLSQWIDPTVLTLLTVLVPIMVVVGIVVAFVPKTSFGRWLEQSFKEKAWFEEIEAKH
ncbi:His1-like major capsid protein [Muninn virus]|nr:His1-like major capsid protein [Muninn virus]